MFAYLSDLDESDLIGCYELMTTSDAHGSGGGWR